MQLGMLVIVLGGACNCKSTYILPSYTPVIEHVMRSSNINGHCSWWCMYLYMYIQWDLFIKDTLGPANLSTVERLSTLRR